MSLFKDKTILDLLTILIAGAGLFAVLTKFDVPQLRSSFLGENPFAIKRDIIESVMTWIFVLLAISGLLIQAYSLISKLNERNFSTSFYFKFSILGFLGIVIIIFCLAAFGRFVAKKIWWSPVIQSQSEGFKLAGAIIKNKGFYDNELTMIERFSDEQKKELPIQRFNQCDNILTQIENLLEINKISGDREERYRRLEKYFKK